MVFIRAEVAGLPSRDAPGVTATRHNADLGSEPARWKALSTRWQRVNASSKALDQYTQLSDEPVDRVSPIEQETPLSAPGAPLPRANNESSKVDPGRNTLNSSPGRIKWDTHPGTGVVPGESVRIQRSAPAAKGRPSVKSHPTAAPIQPATFAQEAASTPGPSTIAVTRATLSLSEPVSKIPDRPAWPRGPFTIVDERYRAQFGDAALTAALREEALGPDEP